MKTAYLYGDSTLSPLTIDLTAFLPDALDFAAQALMCDARMDDAAQRVAQLTESTEKEIEAAQTLVIDALLMLDRATAAAGDSLAGRCAVRIRHGINELVRAEAEGARAAVTAEATRAEQSAANERAAFAKAFEALVLRRALPDAVESIQISIEDATSYGARLRASTAYGLNWTTKIEIPSSHPLGRILRLDRVIERIEVQAPEEAGWLHKEVKIRTQRLDRFYLAELRVAPAAIAAKLRVAPDGSGGGFDLTFADEAAQVEIVRVPENGNTPDLPYEATPDDASALREFHDRLRGMATELLGHKTAVVAATVDDRPLSQLQSPRVLVERLIANIAPVVQNVAKRSLTPGELVLKRQIADNQREELFVSKAVLQQKIESLPSALQRLFDPLELAPPPRPTPEPFTLLREPGESRPVTVPAPDSGVPSSAHTQPMLTGPRNRVDTKANHEPVAAPSGVPRPSVT
ncbi:MAG TPA: hypothetical protein VGY54_09110 [Polyangiaceae bacterium]|jgi:hypothetical protein|nr:hypothetical protein [Polyangiaceae bacterium]